MKIVTRYSVAYCDTPDLSTQYGTWGNCWDTKEEVQYFINRAWHIIKDYNKEFFMLDSNTWLVIEPVQFAQYNIFERLFLHKPKEERITPIKIQGSIFQFLT